MRRTTTELQITRRTLGSLACLVLGLGALFVGLATSATASNHSDGNGANQSGPYDPANVGEGDNQGNGNAPANGTVGKADAKNPLGQYPNGSDHNKGYECDDNKGIGDNGGNPAHSGCSTPAAGDGDGDLTCPDGSAFPTEDLNQDGKVDEGDCDEAQGTESSSPGDGDGDGDVAGDGDGDGDVAGGAEVLGIEANAPAAAPTAVDAGSGAEQGEDNSPLLWILVGTAMVIAGASIALVPARVRGTRSW